MENQLDNPEENKEISSELDKKMTIDDALAGMKRLLEVGQKKFLKMCKDYDKDPLDYDANPEADDVETQSQATDPNATGATDPNATGATDPNSTQTDPNAAGGVDPNAIDPNAVANAAGGAGANAANGADFQGVPSELMQELPGDDQNVQESDDSYGCDSCDFSTNSITEMIEHLKSEHGLSNGEIDSQLKAMMDSSDDSEYDDEDNEDEGGVEDDGDKLSIRGTEDNDRANDGVIVKIDDVSAKKPNPLKDTLLAKLNAAGSKKADKVKPSTLNVTTQNTSFDAFQGYTPVVRGENGAWSKMNDFKDSFTVPEDGFEGIPSVYCIKLDGSTLCQDKFDDHYMTDDVMNDEVCLYESLESAGKMLKFLAEKKPNKKYSIHKCKVIDNSKVLVNENSEEINEGLFQNLASAGSNFVNNLSKGDIVGAASGLVNDGVRTVGNTVGFMDPVKGASQTANQANQGQNTAGNGANQSTQAQGTGGNGTNQDNKGQNTTGNSTNQSTKEQGTAGNTTNQSTQGTAGNTTNQSTQGQGSAGNATTQTATDPKINDALKNIEDQQNKVTAATKTFADNMATAASTMSSSLS